MKTYFEEMFHYERWANGKVLTYLQAQPENAQLLGIFNHLVADALPWLPVLQGEAVSETVLQTMLQSSHWSVEECRRHLVALEDSLDEYLHSLSETDMSQTVSTVGPNGQLFPNTVAEILTHLLSHGQHHRGQIEWIVEKEGGVYLGTSYLPYLRQRGKG